MVLDVVYFKRGAWISLKFWEMPEVMIYRYIRFCKTQDVRFVLLKAIIELVDNVFYSKHFGSGFYQKKKHLFFQLKRNFYLTFIIKIG